jgi:hypothetical protein
VEGIVEGIYERIRAKDQFSHVTALLGHRRTVADTPEIELVGVRVGVHTPWAYALAYTPHGV